MPNFTNEEILEILNAGLEKIASEAEDYEDEEYEDVEYEDDEGDEEYPEEFSKMAHALGLSPVELEYVIDAGLEKVAASVGDVWRQAVQRGRGSARKVKDLSGRGIKAFKGLPLPAKVGIGAVGATGLGLAALRARKGRDNAKMDTTEKIAALAQLSDDELEYVFEQGLEKIAEETGANALSERLRRMLRSPQVRRALMIGGGLGLAGGGAYAALRRRRSKGQDVEKVASMYGLNADELEFIIEQGLEKVAEDGGRLRGLLSRVKGAPGAAWNRFKGLPRAAQIGIGAAGLAGLGGGAYLAARRRRRRGGDAGDVGEKVASALGLTEEELAEVIEAGLEKIASEQEKTPSAAEVVRQMLSEK